MADHPSATDSTLDAAAKLVRRTRRDSRIQNGVTIVGSLILALVLAYSNVTLVHRLDSVATLARKSDCSRIVSSRQSAGLAQSMEGISKYLQSVSSPNPDEREAAKAVLQGGAEQLKDAARDIRACNQAG